MRETWDYIVVGSGFGGAVCALRLVQKGYRVLMLERGRRLRGTDFPRTNWDLRRWLWLPWLGCRGLFKMTFFRHVTVLSGVGVGGGSLVYANTLPVPSRAFFEAPGWAHLAPWERELAPHYETARRMLGAAPNPLRTAADAVMQQVAQELTPPAHFAPTTVAIYFGRPGETVADPYFGGAGPPRTGCTACGACMLGCRVGAKNSLDKNYLYLAERLGLRLEAEASVTWLQPLPGGGYEVTARHRAGAFGPGRTRRHRATRVVLAGGVLGTVPLLLRVAGRPHGLPRLSRLLGQFVRTNAEALVGVVMPQRRDMHRGIAIGSIVHTADGASLEPVRYSAGSGFFRALALPYVSARTLPERLAKLGRLLLTQPLRLLRVLMVRDFARHSLILLYMRASEGHLRLRLRRRLWAGLRRACVTQVEAGPRPTAFMPESDALVRRVATKLDAVPMNFVNETLLNVPTTAHILGGCTMGDSAGTGVIDAQHRVHGHEGLFVVDGSAISANPGVNPSLTICALAERAMGFIPPKPPPTTGPPAP